MVAQRRDTNDIESSLEIGRITRLACARRVRVGGGLRAGAGLERWRQPEIANR
jgi:hypothetical protein